MKLIPLCAFFIFATGSDHECGLQKLIKDLKVDKNAKPVDFPWIAQLRYNDAQQNKQLVCGGSLINKRFVLTTASCVHSSIGPPNKATLGEYYTDPDEYDDYEVQEVGIERMIVNNYYDNTTYFNDIALIKLDADVNFTDHVQPICLPYNKEARVGDKVATSGWSRSHNYSGSVRLHKKVFSTIVDIEECRENYIRFFPISNTHLCTKSSDELTCVGDTGEPVISLNDSKWYLQGIISFGVLLCGSGTFDVHTNVAKYLDWITENIKNQSL